MYGVKGTVTAPAVIVKTSAGIGSLALIAHLPLALRRKK